MTTIPMIDRKTLDLVVERLEAGFGRDHAAPCLLRREFLGEGQGKVSQEEHIKSVVTQLMGFKLPTTTEAALLIRDLVEERDGLRLALDELYKVKPKGEKCYAHAATEKPMFSKPGRHQGATSEDGSAQTATGSPPSNSP